jgi:hypothetical protein
MYIETTEECASKNMSDDADQLHLGLGHPLKLPGFAENTPAMLKTSFWSPIDPARSTSDNGRNGSEMETDFNLKSKSPLIFLQSALIAFTCLGSH